MKILMISTVMTGILVLEYIFVFSLIVWFMNKRR